jgi:hypothetical protein
MRIRTAAALAMAVALQTPGLAQQKPTPKAPQAAPQTQADANKAVKSTGKLPEGWKGRFDNPETKTESLTVASEGPSMTFTTAAGAAGIYYKPGMDAKEDYNLSATFSQLKPSPQPEGYGLFIGGTDLDKPTRRYTYFLIRQDGKYSIGSRNGDRTKTIVAWTDSAAMKGDPKGMKTTNSLAIRAQGNDVHFLIGENDVQKLTRAKVDATGIVGLRVHQNLNVQVDKLTLKSLPRAAR